VSVIDDLLAFDDRPELFEFRYAFGDLLVLPSLRWGLYSRAAEKAFGWQASHAEREPLGLGDRAGFWWRSAWDNPLRIDRRFPFVVFCSTAGAVLRDGRWFDRNNDYFVGERPDDTLVVDAAYRGRYRSPRAPRHLRRGGGLSLVAAARGRLSRPNGRDEAMLTRLFAFLRERFPVPLDEGAWQSLRVGLLGLARQLPHLHGLYARFFERARPRLVVFEDGSYGGVGHILHWARAADVVTAEFQHGLIAPAHLAYNYSAALAANRELGTYQPGHLLLYGDYWAEQVRSTSRKVAIGWPHFSRRAAEHRARRLPADPTLLVISQGTITAKLVAVADALAARFSDRRIVYRLHPGEVPFRERYARLEQRANVRISDSGDIYDCFAEAGAVVGHSSTALVEAAALGLPTFALDDESSRLLIPRGLCVPFRTIDEIAAVLAETPSAPDVAAARLARICAPAWQSNYNAFLDGLGDGPRW